MPYASEGAMMLVVCTGNDKIIMFSAEMQNYIEWKGWFNFGYVARKGSNVNESNPQVCTQTYMVMIIARFVPLKISIAFNNGHKICTIWKLFAKCQFHFHSALSVCVCVCKNCDECICSILVWNNHFKIVKNCELKWNNPILSHCLGFNYQNIFTTNITTDLSKNGHFGFILALDFTFGIWQ